MSLNVNAMMVAHDWQSVGDSQLTFVSELNVEILDVSFTTNITHEQVAAKLINGGEYSGFRFLKSAELGSLIDTYFGSMGSSQMMHVDSGSAASINLTSFLNLIDAPNSLYGPSVSFNTCEYAAGCGASRFSSPYEQALIGGERWYFTPEVVALIDQVGNSTQLLVRDVMTVAVPEPGSLLLLGLGLLLVSGARYKKLT